MRTSKLSLDPESGMLPGDCGTAPAEDGDAHCRVTVFGYAQTT